MNSLKIFLNTIRQSISACSTIEPYSRDALDHPDINAMDLRQLADLPMPYLPAMVAMDEAEAEPASLPLARCA
jgi:hypothetical protein